MAQQIQFVYLAQSEYDALTKQGNILYFTSDTHRIYRGTELYATTSFDQVSAQTATFGDLTVTGNVSMSLSQVEFGRLEASEITVDGSQVSLEGHTHPELSGITESNISKTNATFQDLTVTGDVTFSVDQLDFQSLTASSILVNGSQVSLEGHMHSFADVDGLSNHVSQVTASISAFNDQLQGITQTGISKSSATFGDLTITGELTCSLDQVQFGSISATDITVNGSSVALDGHGHSASDISDFSDAVVSAGTSVFASASHSHDGLQGLTSSSISKDFASFNSISASTATFDNLVVTGDVTMSLSQVQFGSIMASDISVNGSSVALEGHTHAMSDIDGLSELGSSISAMAVAMSGISQSSISKTSATFQDLIVTGDVTFSVEQLDFQSLMASSIVVDGKSVSLEGHLHSFADVDGLSSHISQVTASISAFGEQLQGITSSGISKSTATFGDLTITGELTCSLDQVQFGSIVASDISVNGSRVSLEGHVHGMSEIDGLESSISQLNSSVSAFASAMSGLDATSITKSSATFGDLVVTGSVTFSVDQLDFDTLTASTILLNGSSVSVEGHLHSMSEIQGLESSFSQVNASLSTFSNDLQGIEPTSISKSTATFGDLTVTGSLTLSLDELQFGSIMASEITVNGSSVSLEGHVHSIPDISGLSSILSGITESSIWKNQVSASAATFDQVTADIGNFRLISVSGSANFAVNNVSANAVSVNGTPVSLEGHTHTMSQITGLESYVNAFAAYESRIAALESMVSGLEQALHSINTGA